MQSTSRLAVEYVIGCASLQNSQKRKNINAAAMTVRHAVALPWSQAIHAPSCPKEIFLPLPLSMKHYKW
jgi:hypothetical protein